MELGRFSAIVRRWLLLVLLVPLAAGAITYWYIEQQPLTYTAQVELTVGHGIDNPTADLNALRASAQYLQTFTQLAKTRFIHQQVVDELQLNRNAGGLINQIVVNSDVNTQVMTIEVRDTNRQRAVTIANSLAEALVRYSNANRGNELDAAKVRGDIEGLNRTSAEIDARIKELQTTLSEANKALTGPAITNQQAKIKQMEDALASAVSPEVLKSNEERKTRIAQLEAGLSSTTNIQAQQLLLSELVREDTRLAQEQGAAKDQQRLALDRLSQERNTLTVMQNTNAQLVNQLTGELAVQRNRLGDAQNALSDLYAKLRNVSTNQVRIMDPAVAASPQLPNTWLNVAVAVVAALLLSLTIAFGFDYLQDALRRPEDLAEVTDVPLLGIIPKHEPLQGVGREAILVNSMPESLAAENLRVLSAKLITSNQTDAARSFLFGSFDRGEDAAEIAVNLALILAQTGRRVIVCDTNLRRPLITQLFQLNEHKGLGEALMTKESEPNVVTVAEMSGLQVLPVGAVHSHGFDLLASPKIHELNSWLKSHADVIFFVGAPLREFADSFALAPHVDHVILVARQAGTRRKSVAVTIKALHSIGASILGVVLLQNRDNGIEITTSIAPDTSARLNVLKRPLNELKRPLNELKRQLNELKRQRGQAQMPTTSPEPKPVVGDVRRNGREGVETHA